MEDNIKDRGINLDSFKIINEHIFTLGLLIPVLFCIITFLLSIVFIKFQYSPVYYMDQWGYYDSSIIFENLFSQHNEHRILIPRIFFLIDIIFFQGKSSFLIASIIAVQLSHIGLFWWILGFSDSITYRRRIILISIVSILLFSLVQYENFLWGFQIQFVGVFAAATAAFASIGRLAQVSTRQNTHDEIKGIIWLIVGILCLVSSILMMSNGILTGLLMMVLAFSLRVRRLHLAIICAVFLVSAAIYLHDYHSPSGHAQPLESLMHIDGVLLYAAAYLGGPFGAIMADMLRLLQSSDAESGLLAAQIMGIFGLVISAGLGFLVISQWRSQTCRAEAILLTIISMVVGTAMVTALGRLNFTYAQALSSRYTTPALLFWSATGLLGYLIAARLPSSIGRALSIVGVTVLSILSTIVVLHQMFVICGPSDIRLVRDEAGIAIILGVKDDEALKHIFPNPSIPWQARDFLRQKRLSMFSEPFVEWYGLNIRDKFHLAPKSRCQGVIDSFDVIVSSGSGTLRTHGRVKGWAWDRESASVAQIIVIADERDVIVGLGLSGHWRPDVSKTLPTIKSARVGWQGYVNAVAGNSLTAYAVTDDGQTICQLDQEHVAPQPMIDINEVIQMRKIVSKNIRLNGMWQLDGDDHINVIRPDPNDKVYGSWNGSDANVGNLVLDGLSVPVSRRIVIPLVTGPSSSSLSIAVLDSSGRELMRIQPESPMKWAALVIKVPPDAGATIDLSVDDNGPGWGQWMAIGTPRAVPDL